DARADVDFDQPSCVYGERGRRDHRSGEGCNRRTGNTRATPPPGRLLRGPLPTATARRGTRGQRIGIQHNVHDEEVLGKAYDARLMRRLIQYLRPYKTLVALALGLILLDSALETVFPLLLKIAVDDHIAPANTPPDLQGLQWVVAA